MRLAILLGVQVSSLTASSGKLTLHAYDPSHKAGPSAEEGGQWLGEALKRTSTNSDTHPCLTERLRDIIGRPHDEGGTVQTYVRLASAPPLELVDTIGADKNINRTTPGRGF